MSWKENIPIVLMVLFVIAIYITIIIVGTTGNYNDQGEKRKNLSIIIGVLTPCIIIFTGLIIVYFNTNPAYTNIYLISATSASLLLSLISVSISTMGIQS
jgi:hypothetical protein